MSRARVMGLVGLALCAALGLTSGLHGAVFMAFLYLAISAGWGVVRGRTWWGAMPRSVASGCAGVALLLAVGAAATAPSDGDVAPQATASASAPPDVGVTTSTPPDVSTETVETREPETAPSAAPESTDAEPIARPGTALAAVALLEVKGRAPRTGYDRDLFGQRWVDTDRNGCDQRNDVLRRDLTSFTVKPGTNGCVVATGVLADPYGGTTIDFERGQDTSEAVQIDHVVALSDAWQKGAQQWDAVAREQFANDTLNLLAVDGPLNQQKGDGDAATWLPPNTSFRCEYVARQVAVKVDYDLWVTAAEQRAMADVLSRCPEEDLPVAVMVEPAEERVARTPAPSGSVDASTVTPGSGGECPVKGNHSSSGEWIYHVPSGAFYDVTDPEECFATPGEAEAAGYRASKR